jgi:hypothetical protein
MIMNCKQVRNWKDVVVVYFNVLNTIIKIISFDSLQPDWDSKRLPHEYESIILPPYQHAK